ncbi:MAG: DUF89 family protein [Proteobacteria bacterium]|nr:DUF89 family protein [Pseudomonadota bacterium]MBU1736635.1 DUF89 family protein [Pseudomonadota bacterium]
MKTSPACLPCFMRQAKFAAALTTDSKSLQDRIIQESSALISSFPLDISPPENAVALYRLIAELSDNPDIFSGLKKISNRAALKMVASLASPIRSSGNKLETAARLAIAGNIIDYGAQQEFDMKKTVERSLALPLAINDLEFFSSDLAKARNILYLADNCGELAFDRLLIETLDRPVTLAVKDRPILNDALLEDAVDCGLDSLCRLISNGAGCPGTPLDFCSKEFKNAFRETDLIISKGQGNFETLSETPGPIYFLLMVKCPVVAEHINEIRASASGTTVKTGDMVALKHPLYDAKRG